MDGSQVRSWTTITGVNLFISRFGTSFWAQTSVRTHQQRSSRLACHWALNIAPDEVEAKSGATPNSRDPSG